MLMPPNMCEWVPEDDLAHFVLEAVKSVPLSRFRVNERGTGDEQYPPHMLLALLIYCYGNWCAWPITSNGFSSSNRHERAAVSPFPPETAQQTEQRPVGHHVRAVFGP